MLVKILTTVSPSFQSLLLVCAGRVRQLGIPETSEISSPPQNMLLLHTATELAEKPEVRSYSKHDTAHTKHLLDILETTQTVNATHVPKVHRKALDTPLLPVHLSDPGPRLPASAAPSVCRLP